MSCDFDLECLEDKVFFYINLLLSLKNDHSENDAITNKNKNRSIPVKMENIFSFIFKYMEFHSLNNSLSITKINHLIEYILHHDSNDSIVKAYLLSNLIDHMNADIIDENDENNIMSTIELFVMQNLFKEVNIENSIVIDILYSILISKKNLYSTIIAQSLIERVLLIHLIKGNSKTIKKCIQMAALIPSSENILNLLLINKNGESPDSFQSKNEILFLIHNQSHLDLNLVKFIFEYFDKREEFLDIHILHLFFLIKEQNEKFLSSAMNPFPTQSDLELRLLIGRIEESISSDDYVALAKELILDLFLDTKRYFKSIEEMILLILDGFIEKNCNFNDFNEFLKFIHYQRRDLMFSLDNRLIPIFQHVLSISPLSSFDPFYHSSSPSSSSTETIHECSWLWYYSSKIININENSSFYIPNENSCSCLQFKLKEMEIKEEFPLFLFKDYQIIQVLKYSNIMTGRLARELKNISNLNLILNLENVIPLIEAVSKWWSRENKSKEHVTTDEFNIFLMTILNNIINYKESDEILSRNLLNLLYKIMKSTRTISNPCHIQNNENIEKLKKTLDDFIEAIKLKSSKLLFDTFEGRIENINDELNHSYHEHCHDCFCD